MTCSGYYSFRLWIRTSRRSAHTVATRHGRTVNRSQSSPSLETDIRTEPSDDLVDKPLVEYAELAIDSSRVD
jgi:hypothetical protein